MVEVTKMPTARNPSDSSPAAGSRPTPPPARLVCTLTRSRSSVPPTATRLPAAVARNAVPKVTRMLDRAGSRNSSTAPVTAACTRPPTITYSCQWATSSSGPPPPIRNGRIQTVDRMWPTQPPTMPLMNTVIQTGSSMSASSGPPIGPAAGRLEAALRLEGATRTGPRSAREPVRSLARRAAGQRDAGGLGGAALVDEHHVDRVARLLGDYDLAERVGGGDG